MHRHRLAIILCSLLVLLGCSTLPEAKAPPPPAAPVGPVCTQSPERGKPVFCQPNDATRMYVAGLPEAHGWGRGMRVVLEAPYADGSGVQPVALAAVKEAYGDVAEVFVLYQLPGKRLDGLPARPVRAGERVRLQKFVGRIEEVQ